MINQWDAYAELYDKGIGSTGDDLHEKLIDPVIFRFIGEVRHKVITDAGCGNGYLETKLAPHVKQVIGIDGSRTLLSAAARHVVGLKNVSLKKSDVSKNIPLDSETVDIVIANMLCQYLPHLETFASEAARVLNRHGLLVVIIDHPAHALFLRAQELMGKKNDKFLTSGSYFASGKRTKKSLWDKAVIEYYHRPVKEYINPFTKYFCLEEMDEVSEGGEMPRILGLKWRKL